MADQSGRALAQTAGRSAISYASDVGLGDKPWRPAGTWPLDLAVLAGGDHPTKGGRIRHYDQSSPAAQLVSADSLHSLQLVNHRRPRLALPHPRPALLPPHILHLTNDAPPRIALLSHSARPLIPPHLGFRPSTQIRPECHARVERRDRKRWLNTRWRGRERPYGVWQRMLQS